MEEGRNWEKKQLEGVEGENAKMQKQPRGVLVVWYIYRLHIPTL